MSPVMSSISEAMLTSTPDALAGEVRVASRDLERLGRTTRAGMAMSRAEGLSRRVPGTKNEPPGTRRHPRRSPLALRLANGDPRLLDIVLGTLFRYDP